MRKKRILIVSVVGVMAILIGLYAFKSGSQTFNYRYKHQPESTESMISRYKAGEKDTQIVVLYRENCPFCIKWQGIITSVLDDSKDFTVYVEISKGVPDYITENIESSYYREAKTPFVMVFKNKSFKPVFAQRVISVNSINELKKSIR